MKRVPGSRIVAAASRLVPRGAARCLAGGVGGGSHVRVAAAERAWTAGRTGTRAPALACGDVRVRCLERVEQEMVYFPLVVDGAGPLRAERTVDVVIRTTTADPLTLISMLRDQVGAGGARAVLTERRAGSMVGRTS